MDMFGPMLFVVVLVIPALLLVAMMRRSGDGGGRRSMSERSRVQMQREQNIRRRFDKRRHRVWSAIETAYMDFTTRDQDAPQIATYTDAAPRVAQPEHVAPDTWNDLTDLRLAEMFDQFQTATAATRQKSNLTAR